MLGETVGKYRIVQKLGEGGMGAVYLAEHTLIGHRAAVKVLLPSYSHDVHVVGRFFNEARAAARIKHPGLVDIYDFGTLDDGSAFLVMEWLAGESLAGRIARKGRLRPNFAVEIARQIAGAMAAAHGQQIVHRDLKPDNIILIADGDLPFATRVKVLDFGVAKVAGMPTAANRTASHAVLGTPAYMSPEQCRGAGSVDARTDVYALGCILFEMVTGEPPFTAEGVGEVIADHLRTPPPSPRSRAPNVSEELAAIMLRCLQKDPSARFGSMTALAEALGALAARAPFAARPATPKQVAFPDEETEVDPGLALRLMADAWGDDPSSHEGLAPSRRVSTLDSAASESLTTLRWATRRPTTGMVVVASAALAAAVVAVVAIARRPARVPAAAATASASVASASPPPAPTNAPTNQPPNAPIVAPPNAPIVAPPIIVTPLAPAEVPPLGVRVRYLVDSRPRGATVWRGDTPLGRTPFSEQMAPTKDDIVYVLKLAGYEDGEARFAGGGAQTIELARKRPRESAAAATMAPEAHALDALHTKYRAVAAEYQTFMSTHGDSLEQKWNAVTAKMYADPAHHIDEIVELLDALRRDMATAR